MAWFHRAMSHRAKINDHDDEIEEASIGLIESAKSISSYNDRDTSGAGRGLVNMGLAGLLVVSNIFWIVVNIGLWTRSRPIQQTHGVDFVSANPLPFQTSTVEFDDLLMWNSTSNEVYRAMDPSLPLYFGAPSPAIDAAWAALMRFEYPAIDQNELYLNPSLVFNPEDRHPTTGKFHIALDVFHNLHCLNAVRKELDKDYYGAHHHGHVERSGQRPHEASSAVQAAQRDHIDHCLNHIRQALQCQPDFSPAAMSVFKDTDDAQFFLGNAKTHSCVEWSSVIGWAKAREGKFGFAPMLQTRS